MYSTVRLRSRWSDPGIGTKRVEIQYNGHSMHGALLDNPYLLVTDTASKKRP